MKFEFRGENYYLVRPKQPVPVFVRYGLYAKMRRSANHSTGEYERGISVYEGVLKDGAVHLVPGVVPCKSLQGQGRLCFAVTGRVVGFGSDNEPLLVGVKMVHWPIHVSCRIY